MDNKDMKEKPELLAQMSSVVAHEIRKLLALQGGMVKAGNAPGGGASVTVSLPLWG